MKILILIILIINPAVAMSQAITGTVFRDFNANGVRDNSATFNEVGVGGITVTCTDSAGGTGTTTTSMAVATLGQYTLNGCSGATRVEFSGFITGDYPSSVGTSNNSSIQFINVTRSNIHFGINQPIDYCQTNPQVITPSYVNRGRNSATFNYDGTENIISFPYLSGRDDAGNGTIDEPTNHPVKIVDSAIGSVYGIAYARQKKRYLSLLLTNMIQN